MVVFGSVSFQPSEFAKVAVILFLAWLINRNVKKNIKTSDNVRNDAFNPSGCRSGRSK